MRSLDLPSGSVIVTPNQVPDSVYVLKKGLVGIFDKLERLMAIVYREEPFGLEALFGIKAFMYVKALLPIEAEMYEPDEYRENMKPNTRREILKSILRRHWYVKRRYSLTSEERMRDIVKELKDGGVSNGEISAMALNLSVSDALAFERIRGEFGV